MSQQTKSKFRSKSIDKPVSISYQQKPINPKIHVNILLENKSYNIIGFVIIEPDNNNESLSTLRKHIKEQFDTDQLQSLGDSDTFKFIMDKIPISLKQETLVTIKEIAISDKKAIKLMQQQSQTDLILGSDTSDDSDVDSSSSKINKTSRSRPVSASHRHSLNSHPRSRRHNSEDIHFEKVPHHYQYMSANIIGSPNPSPTFLVIPTTPDTRKTMNNNNNNKSPRKNKRQRSNTSGLLSPFQLSPRFKKEPKTISINIKNKKHNKNKMIYYSIIVRNTILPPVGLHQSFRTLDLLPDQTELSRDTSMSIFTPRIITNTNNNNETEDDDTDDLSSDNSETTIDSQCFSPKDGRQTKLEQKFGRKLPRIQTKLRLSLGNGLNSVTRDKTVSNDQITSILRNALVDNDEWKLKPMKSLKTERLEKFNNNKTNRDFYTPIDNDNDNDDIDMYMNNNNVIIDDKCRFTVIGSSVDDQNNKKKKQKMWIFYDPSELILGLQGVHHSENTPVWMDIICDEETFVMIAEHVRPSIHTLTIEDCISRDGGEKVELFDNYLFIRIETGTQNDINNNNNNHGQDKICMIIFKNMIITYHKSHFNISDIIITEARNRLEKRHRVKCPLNIGWICYTIIDVIVDRMIPEIKYRVQEVQNVENLVFSLSGMSHNELLQRLQIARNWLIIYRARLWTKSTMTYNLMQTHWRNKFLCGIQQQFWNDINDHVARMVDLLSLGQITLESAQNIFVAKLSLEMTEQSNALSDGASRLTAVGSIFLPLSFMSAVWGMNCKVPFQYEGPPDPDNDESTLWADDYFGFCIIFCVMIMVAIGTYRYHIKFS